MFRKRETIFQRHPATNVPTELKRFRNNWHSSANVRCPTPPWCEALSKFRQSQIHQRSGLTTKLAGVEENQNERSRLDGGFAQKIQSGSLTRTFLHYSIPRHFVFEDALPMPSFGMPLVWTALGGASNPLWLSNSSGPGLRLNSVLFLPGLTPFLIDIKAAGGNGVTNDQ